jgi:hypothetical protein
LELLHDALGLGFDNRGRHLDLELFLTRTCIFNGKDDTHGMRSFLAEDDRLGLTV